LSCWATRWPSRPTSSPACRVPPRPGLPADRPARIAKGWGVGKR
jgi:hypothetical protein